MVTKEQIVSFIKANKKLLIIILASVLALACIITGICIAVNANKTPDENEPTKTSWPEAGVYYFDDVNYENTLTLNVGDTFSLYVKGVLHSGKYTLTDSALELDFNAEGVENVTATYEGNVIALTFENASMRFLKKLTYTVSFNVDGGSEVAAQTVVNGKSASKPAQDPTRNGFVFVGWYADAAFTTPYAFGSAPVTGDTTVFARWSAETATGNEFTVKLDANYEGAAALDSVPTSGGKLFDLPSLKRDGYTFGGWWFSSSFNGDMLSHKYEDGMVLDANTTLYALWIQDASGSKLASPVVNVLSGNITWNTVEGARSYDVKVIGPDGEVLIDETTGATTLNVPFSSYAAGEYQIKVTALANSGAENNSETVRYFVNKALTKVSVFDVVGSVLVFNTVEHAEKYLVTVVCGNPEHNHTAFDNGTSRVFNFANCTMTSDGIKFTVTAVADGYASSTSDVFVYNRTLDSVSGFRFDEASQTLYWNEVASAEEYMVSVKCGNASHNHEFVNFGSQTFVSLKECAPVDGGIVVKVFPKSEGYVSPDASEYVYNKTALETPANLLLNGTVLSWNAVTGAEKYEVSVNGTAYEATEATFDLVNAIDFVEGVDYSVTVRAIGANSSLATDVLVARYYEMNDKVSYAKGVLTWTPVIGADYYEVQVNDGEIVKAEGGVYFAPVTLNKNGENVVKVRFVDGKTVSEWATTTVVAHRVTFDTLGGNFVADQFVAVGDPIALPSAEKAGYSFVAWYNVPGGATSNGAAYDDEFFAENGPIVLFAYYKANKYEVIYNYGVGGSADAATGEVTFDGHYQLVVPTASDVAGAFGGWFSAPYGMGTQYTDESGKSLAPWTHLEGKELYAFWVDEALSFTLTKINGNDAYAVSKGPRISLVSEVTIPATYRGLPVAFVSGNAFENCSNLKVINLPETIEQISLISPFAGCSSLEAINVYDVDGVADPVFTSVDGVLLQNLASGKTKLTLVPMAKSGSFHTPAGVTEIPEAAFAGSKLSKVIVSAEVTTIGREAFRDASNLTSVVFEVAADGSSAPLTIGTRAFLNCTKLAKITLPARLTEIKLQRYSLDGTNVKVTESENAFEGCLSLEAIVVASNSQNYKSIDNVLFSKDGRTLLLAPASVSGTFVVPDGTRNISAGAFVGCTNIEELVLPSSLALIGDCAFYGLNNLQAVTFKGTSFDDLSVGMYAFRNCDGLETVTLEEGSRLTTLGEGAFMGCTSLESFSVPATMTKMGASVFADCSNLSAVDFAADGKTLEFGQNAFQNCTSLTTVNLPANVSKIPGVFAGCTSLTEVNVDPASTYFTSEDGVVYDVNKTEIIFFPSGKSGEYATPETLTTINNGVFQNVKNITKMTISGSVTYIGNDAFNSASIDEIEFVGEPAGALVIGDNAFRNASLGTLTLPSNTVSIGNSAFYMVNADAIVLNEGITTLGDYAFWGAADVSVTVPASVKSIGAYCFSGYVESDWWYGDTYYCPEVTLTVENSMLETIGDYAFQGNTNIEDIEIPASVLSIGNYAFFECFELGDVTFAEGSVLKSIGAYAFATYDRYDASSYFTEITIPASVETIGAYAFYETNLEKVVFEDGEKDLFLGHTFVETGYNESMGTYYRNVYRGNVFANCDYLEEVVLPSRLTTLEQSTFYYAGYYTSGLEVTISNIENSRLTTIGEECFRSSYITSFVIPKSVSNLAPVTDPVSGETYDRLGIGKNAFYGLYSYFTSITFEMGGTLPLTIGAGAFDNAAKLENVVLPARLDTYNSYTGEVIAPLANGALVFNSCDNLTSISIEEAAGSYYTSLNGVLMTADLREIVLCPMSYEGSFTVPATVTKIHANAFLEATKLTELVFEGGVEDMHIGESAFKKCTSLVNVVLSDNVATLGSEAFFGCTSLESLTLSKSLTNFTSSVVYNCTKLAAINVSSDGNGEYYSSANGILYNADKSALITYPLAKTDAEVVVDSNVKSIHASAFANNEYIVTVILPEGLVEIQDNAFDFCYGLTTVNIPSTVQKIGNNAFRYCEDLETINFAEGGDDLLIIGNYAFAYTYSLETLALTNRVYSIGNNAFNDSGVANLTFGENSALVEIGDYAFYSTDLIQLDIPAGVVEIGRLAFYECADLLEITFGEGLISIGDNAFAGCSKLISVSFPASLKTLGASVFYYYDYDEYKCSSLESVTFAPNSQLEYIPAGTFAYTALKTFTVPAGVKYIEGVESSSYRTPSAFYAVSTLEAVYFENGSLCTEIGAYAFEDCSNLQTIEIPGTVSNIGNYAFRYCSSLESITIPENTVNLGKGAFWGCGSLSEVELRTKATALPDSFFFGCSSLADITLPAAVSSLGSDCFGDTALESFKVDPRNTFFKAVDGILYTADGTGIVMVPAAKNIGDFVVPNTITSINDKLFEDNQTITSLTFEGGRTEYISVGRMAFADCSNLSKVVFTEKISYIDEEAFYYCTSLNIVELAFDMTEDMFGYDCFYNCNIFEIKNLSSMDLKSGDYKCEGLTDNALHIYSEGESKISSENGFTLMDVDDEVYLLSYNGNETTVTVPEGVTFIYTQAFNNSEVTKLILSSTVKEIGAYAFYDNYDIKEVVANEGLEKIGYQAFRYSSLTTINIPSTVTSVGDQAFNGSNLTGTVAIGENLTTIGYRAFYTSYPITFVVSVAEALPDWDSSWYRSGSGYGTVLWGFTGEEITYTFETNGGSAVESITSGMPITIPAGPTLEGYYFLGWYDNAEFDGEAITGTYYSSSKTSFYAKWLSADEFEALYAGTAPEYAIEAVNGVTFTIADNSSSSNVYAYLKVTATEDVTLTITTTSGDDTVIRIYDNASDANGGSYNYIKNKDSGYDETLTYEFYAGTTYYIVTYAYYGSFTGEITTTVTVG